jgi:hypothetical protein
LEELAGLVRVALDVLDGENYIDAGSGNKGRAPDASLFLPHMYLKMRRDNINGYTVDENTSWNPLFLSCSCHLLHTDKAIARPA